MINVLRANGTSYQLMVALPVNRKLPGNADVFPEKMVRGNFMSAEITGPAGRIDSAIRQMAVYFEDHQKIAMAIPFQSLITNRKIASDSNTWVTRIYFPVLK